MGQYEDVGHLHSLLMVMQRRGCTVMVAMSDVILHSNAAQLYCTVILIHSKSEQIGGDLLLSTEKLAEKVRISGRQNFAINVRLS